MRRNKFLWMKESLKKNPELLICNSSSLNTAMFVDNAHGPRNAEQHAKIWGLLTRQRTLPIAFNHFNRVLSWLKKLINQINTKNRTNQKLEHGLSVANMQGSRDGVVVRALASHQCGPGSILRSSVSYGLSLLVLFLAPRGFSPGTPVFPSLPNQHFSHTAPQAYSFKL